jgi:hypothetical protein
MSVKPEFSKDIGGITCSRDKEEPNHPGCNGLANMVEG